MEEEELVVVMKSSSSSSSKCEDCGNQAKKDCGYSRCRTCCKNKGFHCETHVRSTWIPLDRRRRHRPLLDQPTTTTSTSNLHHHLLHGDHHNIHIPKRHKHNPYSEELEFPAAMNSLAIFNCVQVRSMDDTVNEIAYQTSVNIGGHVFSGLLYDQGPHQENFINNSSHRGEASTTHTLVHHHHRQQQQQHNLDLMMMSDSIHARDDGATMPMPSLPAATTNVSHEQLFPLTNNSFRPNIPYFSHYPRP